MTMTTDTEIEQGSKRTGACYRYDPQPDCDEFDRPVATRVDGTLSRCVGEGGPRSGSPPDPELGMLTELARALESSARALRALAEGWPGTPLRSGDERPTGRG